MKNKSYADATGRLYKLLPPGHERDEFITLVRWGASMGGQHVGKRPEFLQNYVQALVDRLGEKPSFAGLLYELDLESDRRNTHGESASPIEKVDRVWELITYHDPKKGRIQRAFKTFENKLSKCKINSE